jgi:hypothetical protein
MNEDSPESSHRGPQADADDYSHSVHPDDVILLGRPGDIPSRSSEPAQPARRSRLRRALILFVLTCLSTFFVQFRTEEDPRRPDAKEVFLGMTSWELSNSFRNGLTYSTCLLTILGAHELGHYIQACRNRVPASLPFFIPMPLNQIGTMGAVIVQQSGVANRRAMFDIAISGPLAGLVFALPITYWGVVQAQTAPLGPIPPGKAAMIYGDPLILKWIMHMARGPLPDGSDLLMNSTLFAGWVGILITSVNLIPIGQLDGGHILYCLIGRRAHFVARSLFFLAAIVVAYNVVLGNHAYMVWWLMLVLLWFIGTRHPPTADDRVPLGPARIVLGWLTLLFVVIGMTATPFDIVEGPALSPAAPASSDSQPES